MAIAVATTIIFTAP